jgi:SAM-dependent methyltransferase
MRRWLMLPFGLARRAIAIAGFVWSFFTFQRLARSGSRPDFSVQWKDRFACLDDATPVTYFDHHYVYHLGWAARKVAAQKPASHTDISSSLYFSALISAHTSVRFFDLRPARMRLANVSCEAADITCLPFSDRSIHSLSCMHVAEHIGLGRYGDPMDADGDLRAMRELQRVTAPGGSLLFVVPIGQRRIQFNAHRIYSPEEIVRTFSELTLADFSLITDNPDDGIIPRADFAQANAQRYGCGCFHFIRERE